MSEQTIQDGLYSIPVRLDKYICRSLGSTTIKDLVKSKEISGLTLKECNNIKARIILIQLHSPRKLLRFYKICPYHLLRIRFILSWKCLLLNFYQILGY